MHFDDNTIINNISHTCIYTTVVRVHNIDTVGKVKLGLDMPTRVDLCENTGTTSGVS